MVLVALLTGEPLGDTEAAQLAADLGVTAFDARMTVAQGYPGIVATRANADEASALVTKLRARGCDATAVEAFAIVAADAMVPMDHFRFDADAVVTPRERLEYADILCLLRATHRTRIATGTTTTERRFSAGRSLLTGGLSNTATVKKQTIESAESREQVLYVFRRGGAQPWLLREQGSHYEGLGSALERTVVANFATTIRLLRSHAPTALYDERLVARARVAERSSIQGTAARNTVTVSSSAGVDALAHLVAMAIGDSGAGPYRR